MPGAVSLTGRIHTYTATEAKPRQAVVFQCLADMTRQSIAGQDSRSWSKD